MRRRRGLNSAILLLLFSRLRFNSRNPSKQELHPQTDPPNAASAASFNPKTDSAIIENALAYLSPILRWAEQEDLIPFVPRVLRVGRETQRDRILRPDEIRAIW